SRTPRPPRAHPRRPRRRPRGCRAAASEENGEPDAGCTHVGRVHPARTVVVCDGGGVVAVRVEFRREGVRLTAPDEFTVPPAIPLEPAHDWLLTRFQRGNRYTALRAWTEGNQVRPLVH